MPLACAPGADRGLSFALGPWGPSARRFVRPQSRPEREAVRGELPAPRRLPQRGTGSSEAFQRGVAPPSTGACSKLLISSCPGLGDLAWETT